MNMDTDAVLWAIERPALPVPLSMRLAEARAQLGSMFDAGDFARLRPDTCSTMKGIELFLLVAAGEAFDLEMAAAPVRRRRFRLPRWLGRR